MAALTGSDLLNTPTNESAPGEEPPLDASRDGEDKPPRTISSQELLQGESEVWIEHEGEMYRLRVTGNGRLYLSK